MFKNKTISKFRLWTDSTIVLDWLSSCPRKWQTFVSNRVSFVLQHTNRSQWSHVPSIDNPADCASRGVSPPELIDHHLWWKGPVWLMASDKYWPNKIQITSEISEDALKEQKPNSIALVNIQTSNDWLSILFGRCSKFTKLLFVIVRVLLFVRSRASNRVTNSLEFSRQYNNAKADAFNLVIRQVQHCSFSSEINAFINNKPIPNNSKLTSLFPFIDQIGLLRVGGRLSNADIPYEMKHPIIIPSKHHITTIIIRDEHINQLHAGPKVLMAILRQKYHIMRCKDAVRAVIGRCVKCVRLKARQQQQLMGQLPQSRVTYQRPFFSTRVDYAGSLFIKSSRLRSAKIIKAYLALFICMTTKAVHLELVSDMTTEAFLAALRRFHGRRGICGHLYSDNGSNFIGAEREMQASLAMVAKDSSITRYFAVNNIEWHFIPPAAPNFGGLWEAAIKSTKYHLKRVIGETRLTYEEMTTLLIQIEAILNSRPLCEMTANDIDPLTPGHFLIGHPLTLLPEQNLLQIKENRLSRWQHIQKMAQHFWQKWHNEYLLSLQLRQKWQATSKNPTVGELVVVMEKDVPPTKWLLGRIVKVIPGRDGLVRVLDIKTKLGEITRPITKICILPSDSVESMGAGCLGSSEAET